MKPIVILIQLCNVIVTFAATPLAESLGKTVTSPHLLLSVSILFVVILIVIVVSLYSQSKSKLQRFNSNEEYHFLVQCERCGLDASEVLEFRNELKKIGVALTPNIFNSEASFESLVDRKCTELLTNIEVIENALKSTEVLHSIRKKLGFDTMKTALELCSTRRIAVGQKMDIVPFTESTEKSLEALVIKSNELFIELKYIKNNFSFEPIGHDVLVLKGVLHGLGVYYCTMRVVSIDASTSTMQLLHTTLINTHRFRDFVRMPIRVPIKCRTYDKKIRGEVGETTAQGEMRDLSSGGLSFESTCSFENKEKVGLEFELGEKKYSLIGEIVNIEISDLKSDKNPRFRVIFKDIKYEHSVSIVRYILELQKGVLSQ